MDRWLLRVHIWFSRVLFANRQLFSHRKRVSILTQPHHDVNVSLFTLGIPFYRHHTPQAVLLGLEGSDPETIDTGTISSRYEAILANRTLHLGGTRRITFDMDRDMLWRWDQVLKTHPNGMRFSCFGEEGELLATNEYYRYVL
jgi:hypothetical protein